MSLKIPRDSVAAVLLWVVNLGCIDLNQWYARCDDVDRADYLHFDLDPGMGATFGRVLEAARVVRDAGVRIEDFTSREGASIYPNTCVGLLRNVLPAGEHTPRILACYRKPFFVCNLRCKCDFMFDKTTCGLFPDNPRIL